MGKVLGALMTIGLVATGVFVARIGVAYMPNNIPVLSKAKTLS